jgi:hypothetical protein
MRILFVVIIGLVFLNAIKSCRNSPNHSEIISTTYQNYADSTNKSSNGLSDTFFFHFRKTIYPVVFKKVKSKLKEIEGFLLNRSYGHHFSFTDNGKNIETYSFFVGENDYNTYYLEFKNGEYVEGGIVLVDYFENEIDSIKRAVKKIDFFFSTFPRKDINVFISFDGNKYNPVITENSTLMPFLKEISMEINTLQNKKIYFKIETSSLLIDLKEIPSSKIYFDTIYLQ